MYKIETVQLAIRKTAVLIVAVPCLLITRHSTYGCQRRTCRHVCAHTSQWLNCAKIDKDKRLYRL